ncbi:acid-sensing system DNA-binding response regulator EvgA [Enterobacter cloacae]|uniref:acid-sensing system DNA-binding response regulator EvgA n=1 Tax=Enterobacter cloacae TaxID=550 RepID=UPI002B20F084|nr:acid-sensing system DNA-binding response regulator EvgA [Enterobacter cloacae]MEA5217560.1 acid-sensing system DNA-binding response regulator EvgA [Enterobacter cloacae]
METKLKGTAVIVDDHPLALVAIRALLESNGIKVLAQAEDGNVALKIINELNPDIAIIDLDLPIRSGIDLVEKLRHNNSKCIIIIVSAKSDSFYGKRCADVGANAFVSKKKDLENIIKAIEAAWNGYCYFPFHVNKFIGSQTSDAVKLDSLSVQEVKVMQYLLKGMDLSLISMEMNISNKTVSTYKSRLYDKLNCSSLIELYDFANRNKIN